jgi:hypothetical protein
VNLAEVRPQRVFSDVMTVLNQSSAMGIPFDAQPFKEANAVQGMFAETMPRACLNA